MAMTESEQLAKTLGLSAKLKREREEDRETLAMLEQIRKMDREAAADRVEQALSGWKDDFGRPIEGFESPRFLTARQREYMDWIHSEDGARTRANVHPNLHVEERHQSWGGRR